MLRTQADNSDQKHPESTTSFAVFERIIVLSCIGRDPETLEETLELGITQSDSAWMKACDLWEMGFSGSATPPRISGGFLDPVPTNETVEERTTGRWVR